MINQLLRYKSEDEKTSLLKQIEELLTANRKALVEEVANKLTHINTVKSDNTPGGDIPRIDLSPRERIVVRLIVQGKYNKEIGANIYLKENGVKCIVSNILEKLGLESRVQLAVFAVLNNMVTEEDLAIYKKQDQ